MRKAPANKNMVTVAVMRHVRAAFMGQGAILGAAYQPVAVHCRSQFLQRPASETPDKIIITRKRPTAVKTIGALLQRILRNIHLARGKSDYGRAERFGLLSSLNPNFSPSAIAWAGANIRLGSKADIA